MNWYCIVNGAQRGPMSTDELQQLVRSGVVKPQDYVWNESFGDQWRRAQDVAELRTLPAPAPIVTIDPFAAPPSLAPETPAANLTPLTGVPGNRPGSLLAIQQAWNSMVAMLFHNASFARWMGMAFCVWLSIAGMNEPNLAGDALLRQIQPDPMSLKSRIEGCTTPDQMMSVYVEVLDQMTEKARELVTPARVATAGLIWLLLLAITCWVRARGTFMVMHRWHYPDDTLAQSWAAGRGLSQSLFLFKLGLGVIMCVLTAGIGFALQVSFFGPLLQGAALDSALTTRAFLLILGLSVVLTAWLTVAVLVNHFVVPIMYWRRVGVMEAWRVVMELCNERPGSMTIYFTLYIILLHVLLVVMAVAACCTCCCVCYLSLLPFINGIIFLPAVIFLRGLGISFLRQWRPDLETVGR